VLLTANSDYFFMQLIGLRDGEVTCLLRGRKYFFHPNSIYINLGPKIVTNYLLPHSFTVSLTH